MFESEGKLCWPDLSLEFVRKGFVSSPPKSTQPHSKLYSTLRDFFLTPASSLSWGYPIIYLWMENQHFSIFICGLLTAATSAPFHFSQVHYITVTVHCITLATLIDMVFSETCKELWSLAWKYCKNSNVRDFDGE